MSVANRFDPKKNHMNLLFHHGRVLQDSEMNELMSLFWHQISTLTGVILQDGVCTKQPVFSTDQWKCPEAFVMIDGQFVFVPDQDLPAVKGFCYRKRLVTSEEDPALEDQTEGSVNEGQAGADREIVEAKWVAEEAGDTDEWKFVRLQLPAKNLISLTMGNWDAVVSSQLKGDPDQCRFSSLESALQHVKPGARIFVKDHAEEAEKSIKIELNDLYIEFGPGVKYLASADFPGTGDDSEKSIFYVTGRYVTLSGGIHGFPDHETRSPDNKPKIATATNDTVFFNNVREVGSSKYLLISDNINVNGRIPMEL